MRKHSKNTLLIGGLHIGGSGYPNARQTLEILRNRLQMQIVECGAWLPESMHLWRLGRARLPTRAVVFFRLLFGNLASAIKVITKQSKERIPTYIPYPAIFFLWWISWIPAPWRPRCIADAYISIWDSMYRDRSDGTETSLAARSLKAFEARALQTAELVLVDTVANKHMFVHEFGLQEESITTLPLAIQDDYFLNTRPKTATKDTPLTVLFVGTLIPLHGITTILGAIRLLASDPRFRFYLLGDGQEAYLIEQFISEFNTEQFTWIKKWVDLRRIAEEVGRADICLGVFGGKGKAQRVLPFKIYMYLAGGKAIVNQSVFSLPESTPPPPILTADAESAQDVANAITRLADDENLRTALASDARSYYVQYLGHERLATDWLKLLAKFNPETHVIK